MKRLAPLLVLLAACAAPTGENATSDVDALRASSAMTEVTSFGKNPGALRMFEHVPPHLADNAPVVVVLHGCLTNAATIADTGWNDLADQRGFVVVYPQQSYFNNGDYCFNWADPMGFGNDDAERGGGESESVREMTQTAIKKHHSDTSRVFAAGFSAGAAMAIDLAAAYPDLYAGVASFAGVPYGCASTLPESLTCMIPGISRSASDQAKRAAAGYPGYSGRRPRMSIWQGGLDNVVYPMNQGELVKQWATVNGISTKPTTTDTVGGHAHASYADVDGTVILETYLIEDMWHGLPVDPANGCGHASQFAPAEGICGASRVLDFFGL
jgi:poly(hydroxyalkanoate) depolymerase family esterase